MGKGRTEKVKGREEDKGGEEGRLRVRTTGMGCHMPQSGARGGDHGISKSRIFCGRRDALERSLWINKSYSLLCKNAIVVWNYTTLVA